ncbi:MAG: tRNA lysidine(34) synthetase TilS [bacterium]
MEKNNIVPKFLNSIKKNNLISRKDKLLLAVSGGSDSMAMAHLAKNLKNKTGIAYIDHKLRKESASEKKFVRALAKKLKMPFYARSSDVAGFAEKNKKSVEDAAREIRYRHLAGICGKNGFSKILTAHTRSDLFETVLIKILRGGGLASFYGIKTKTKIFGASVVRPMLDFDRNELKNFLRRNKILFITDPSNKNQKFLRNKIRRTLIPFLSKNFGGQFEKRLLALSNQAEDLAEYVSAERRESGIKNSGKLDINKYLSYNKFLRKCFLAEFLEREVNSGYIGEIDRFIRRKKGGSFTLRGFDFVVKKGVGTKHKREI